uniref:Chitin-binding type-4 domain-containing protein n=1 Tax=Glossina brevipalpis TaxID=37001 RepID=A0A1A9W887_9MUSC
MIGSNGIQAQMLLRMILLSSAFLGYVRWCLGHGRLIEPPSRASAWRYGFNTPPDYNDHELYCGGFTRQWKQNDGKCGECGDAWDMPRPRPHEYGGQWGQGVTVRRYLPASEITIRVELTASHMGYFEFRLCPDPNAKQECLDRNLLTILSGAPAQPAPGDIETRFYPRNGSRIYEIKALLPDIKCKQCVLQWRYVAGNNWGMCPDGNGAVGCGPQEEFRSCSDIGLGESVSIPKRPVRPTIRTTVRPKGSLINETTTLEEKPQASESFSYAALFLALLILLLVLCSFMICYLYRNERPRVDKWKQHLINRLCKKKLIADHPPKLKICPSIPSTISMPKLCNSLKSPIKYDKDSTEITPIPPPRLKRQARIKEMSSEESSVA